MSEKQKYVQVGSRWFPVVEMLELPNGQSFPVVDLPLISDEKWMELAHEKYREE